MISWIRDLQDLLKVVQKDSREDAEGACSPCLCPVWEHVVLFLWQAAPLGEVLLSTVAVVLELLFQSSEKIRDTSQ